ncbi:selenium metabolism-associated LysR family transcriptional regulator [Candidatus Contubernalis alkaliaceticus]|uniref:selenium metabolism-associated LysR family transcriptional regulator n=1 Tax=Candidatus Contubernalis alkaliaceticus TaxID=338645 RepID=UPI001F4C39B1|nr:selenium metabolism-associated LysR family transcriptional regulator [Candidatus Contubernalis alkalaceticus]UNC92964.1 LysR family transcriptional regulator [Candidatus Contubernalis alkalaceticus]
MKISILKTFLMVVEEKSLTRAAEALYLTQPAVSKHIKMLEKHFSTRLFHRQGQKITLTEGGEILYLKAKRILKEWENTEQSISELSSTVGGVLRIGASTIPGEYLLPYLLGSFKKEYPDVEIKLEVADTLEVVRKILAEEIHLGVVGAWIERKKLMAKNFADDELVLIMHPQHPLAKEEKVSPSALVKESFIWREKGSGTRRVVEEKLQKVGIAVDNITPVLELGSTQAIITAVEAGLGISFVSFWAARRDEALKRIAVKKLDGFLLKRKLYYLYPKEQYLPRAAIELLSFSEKLDIPSLIQF